MNYGKYAVAIRLMMLKEFFEANAGKKQYVNRQEIEAYLEKMNVPIEKKTLYRDIQFLNDEFDMQIQYDVHKKAYRLMNPPFEQYELRLMVDCIQAAKFITNEEANQITNKIKKLAIVSDRASLNRQVYVKDRIFRVKDSVVRKADVIHTALQEKKQIRFRYFKYVAKRSERKEYYPGNHGEWFIVNPKRMVWENGEYLLEIYQNTSTYFGKFNVECMSDIALLSSPCITEEKTPIHNTSPEIEEMLHGKLHTVTLRARNNAAWDVFERWGSDIITIPDGAHHFTFTLKVHLNDDFYFSVASLGCYVKIISPPEAITAFGYFREELNELYDNDTEPMNVWSQDELDEYYRNINIFEEWEADEPGITEKILSQVNFNSELDEDRLKEEKDVTGGHSPLVDNIFL